MISSVNLEIFLAVLIQLAFQQSKTQAVQDPLIQRNNALDKAFQEEDNNFNRYWLSYGLYNQALIADRLEDKKAAEELIDRAIELLNPLEEDPESQALLALQLGYSTRFKSYSCSRIFSISTFALITSLVTSAFRDFDPRVLNSRPSSCTMNSSFLPIGMVSEQESSN